MQDRLRWLRKKIHLVKIWFGKEAYEYWNKEVFTLKHVTITITGHVM